MSETSNHPRQRVRQGVAQLTEGAWPTAMIHDDRISRIMSGSVIGRGEGMIGEPDVNA